MKILILLLSSILFLSSCSSQKKQSKDTGFKMVEKVFDMFKGLQKSMGTDSSELAVTEAKLKNNSRFAVFFVPPEKKSDWKWSREEKERFISSLSPSKKTGRIFELIGLDNNVDITGLRTQAAHQGADALLLVRGIPSVETKFNGKALSYLLVVPTLFVEGNNVESTFTTQAILWDVRKPFVHLGVESEGEWNMERPLVFRQKSRALNKAKVNSLHSLSKNVTIQLSHL